MTAAKKGGQLLGNFGGSNWGSKWDPKNDSYSGFTIKVGEKIGDLIKDKKISDKFTFDRGGYLYHGRIKELAMGIRSKGIKFQELNMSEDKNELNQASKKQDSSNEKKTHKR